LRLVLRVEEQPVCNAPEAAAPQRRRGGRPCRRREPGRTGRRRHQPAPRAQTLLYAQLTGDGVSLGGRPQQLGWPRLPAGSVASDPRSHPHGHPALARRAAQAHRQCLEAQVASERQQRRRDGQDRRESTRESTCRPLGQLQRASEPARRAGTFWFPYCIRLQLVQDPQLL